MNNENVVTRIFSAHFPVQEHKSPAVQGFYVLTEYLIQI
jgi:hypothetical protein